MSEEFSGFKYVFMAKQRVDSKPYVIAVFGPNSISVKNGDLENMAVQLRQDNRLYDLEIMELKVDKDKVLDEALTLKEKEIEIVIDPDNDPDIVIEPILKSKKLKRGETKIIN